VTVDDLPHVPDGQAGGGDIQLAANVHHCLASRPDPVTQLQRHSSLEIVQGARRHDCFLFGGGISDPGVHHDLRPPARLAATEALQD